jgi:hypothetical protein
MPTKLSLGYSKKMGQPDFGSLGASCQVEVELDHGLLEGDLERFHSRVRQIYTTCRQAVLDELARHTGGNATRALPHAAANGNGMGPGYSQLNGNGQPNGSHVHANGHAAGSAGHAASGKQLEYARQLAMQIRGLGVRRLEALAQRAHDKPLAALSSLEASALINLLRAVKTGKLELGRVLAEGAVA